MRGSQEREPAAPCAINDTRKSNTVEWLVAHTGWAPDPPMVGAVLGSDPLSAWWLGLAPVTLEFRVRFPNERNQGKQALPVLKYRVPHGSQGVMGRLIHTGLGSSSLIAHVLHSPPPPREQLCNRSCSNKTHTSDC